MTRQEAEDALEEANLKAEVIEETSRTVEEGYVISQEVEAESEAYAGDTIKIHVSKGTGIRQVTVENVVGQTEANARTTLEGQGLKVTVTYVDATTDNGKVTKQSVTAGTTVDEGTTVTLTVNKVAETKNVSVIINLKQITGGYTEDEEDETASRTVNISVNGETRTEFVMKMLINYGIYVLTCSDKIGLNGEFIRLASRSKEENTKIIQSLHNELRHS